MSLPRAQSVLLELKRRWVIGYGYDGDAGARHLARQTPAEKLMRGGVEMQVLQAGCVHQTCQHIGSRSKI